MIGWLRPKESQWMPRRIIVWALIKHACNDAKMAPSSILQWKRRPVTEGQWPCCQRSWSNVEDQWDTTAAISSRVGHGIRNALLSYIGPPTIFVRIQNTKKHFKQKDKNKLAAENSLFNGPFNRCSMKCFTKDCRTQPSALQNRPIQNQRPPSDSWLCLSGLCDRASCPMGHGFRSVYILINRIFWYQNRRNNAFYLTNMTFWHKKMFLILKWLIILYFSEYISCRLSTTETESNHRPWKSIQQK